MKISAQSEDVIITHALGSCLGISVHDPVAQVGGILHVMMPLAKVNPDKARKIPCAFVDSGLPAFFRELQEAGACRNRFVLKVAGGTSSFHGEPDHFAIGKRNYITLRKMLWKIGLLIDAEDVGGEVARTMRLEVATGLVYLSTAGKEKELKSYRHSAKARGAKTAPRNPAGLLA